MIKKLLLTILLLTAPLTTHAYFSDEEVSGAIMSAGRIAFTMSATTTSLAPSATSFTFAIDDESTQTPTFGVGTASTTCSGVTFTATQNQFSGEHTVGIQGAVANCAVTIVTEAWQQNFTQGQGGFTASSTLTFTFTDPNAPQPTATVVLNEIYPNPNNASSSPLNTEWIELYNGTGVAIDVSGWQVRVNNTTHSITASCTGAANKMAPMNNATTVVDAGGLLLVEFCNNTSPSKLANGGAMVELSTSGAGANVADAYTYQSTPIGKSHARIPDGWQWVDPIPTPGAENKATVADLEADPTWNEYMIEYALESGAIVEEPERPITDYLTLVTSDSSAEPVDEAIAEEAIKEDVQIVVEPGDEPLIEEIIDDLGDTIVEEKTDDGKEVSESESVEEEAEEEAVEEPEEKAQEDAVEEIEEEVQEEVVQEVVEEVVEEVEQEAAAPVVAGEKFEG